MLFRALLIVGFIASAFLFFRMTREDIKLLSLRLRDETIFDIFFLTSLAVLVGARIVYVASHFGDFGINLLKILVFTHFPGFSLMGGFLGGFIFLRWFLKRKNILRARIFDLIALSALPLIILGFLGAKLLWEATIFFVLLLFLFRVYKTRFLEKLNFQGLPSLALLIVVAMVSFRTTLLTAEQIISIIVLLFAVTLFIKGAKSGHL